MARRIACDAGPGLARVDNQPRTNQAGIDTRARMHTSYARAAPCTVRLLLSRPQCGVWLPRPAQHERRGLWYTAGLYSMRGLGRSCNASPPPSAGWWAAESCIGDGGLTPGLGGRFPGGSPDGGCPGAPPPRGSGAPRISTEGPGSAAAAAMGADRWVEAGRWLGARCDGRAALLAAER